jgi:hypothetical protein
VIRREVGSVPSLEDYRRKATLKMLPNRLRSILCVATGLVGLTSSACGGRGPLDTDIEAYDAPNAAGLRDASVGTPPGIDAGRGSPTLDAGTSRDAGRPGFPTIPGFGADAGGIIGCFACAQDMCGTQVGACLASQACLAEGTCDLTTCLAGMGGGTTAGGSSGGGLGGFGGIDLQCFQSCQKDPQGSADLFAAVECTFTSCGTECLSALTSAGQGGGLGGLGGGTLGGLGGTLGGLGGTLGGLGGFGTPAPASSR